MIFFLLQNRYIFTKVKYYLYRHIRLDKNEPFYVGIGTKSKDFDNWKSEYARAFDKTGRHAAWFAIVLKTEFDVEILFESDNYEQIRLKEKEFINLYKSKLFDDGTLVNASSSDFCREDKKNLLVQKRKINNSKFFNGKVLLRIDQYDYNNNLLNSFNSIEEVCEKLKVNKNSIRKHFVGEIKTCRWTILKPIFSE